jgi:Tol biopolymer transport system component
MTLVSGSGGSATQGGDADSGLIGLGAGFSARALAVTPDGRFIAFVSQATDLASGQSGAAGNVFLYDSRSPGLTLLSGVGGSSTVGAGGDVSLLPPGSPSSVLDPISNALASLALSISDDGGLVAFVSQANDIVPGQTGPAGIDSVFLYSRAAGRATLVTGVRGSATAADAGQSGFPVLSGDGSRLAFHSVAFDLGSGFFDGNGAADVFTYDTATRATALVSRAAFQQVAPGNSYPASVSGNGRYTVFTSTARDLVPNQTTATFSDSESIFLFDQQAGTNRLVNHVPGLPDTTGDVGIPFTLGQRPLRPLRPVVSADGSTVAFTTGDDNLVSGEPPRGTQFISSIDVYLYDVASGQVRLVNHVAGSDATPNLSALEPAVSASGRYVAYVLGSSANPIPAPSNLGQGAIALYDSMTDTTTMITPLDSMNQGLASDPTISDDGRFVSYLDQPQGSANQQVYVYDRVTGRTVLVSHDNSSPTSTTPANGASSAPVISHDGTAVAFVSAATNLVPGQVASGFTNVFLYRNDTSGGDGVGPVRLVSGALGSATAGGGGNSDSPAVGKDGSYVAYRSDADNLVAGQSGATGNVFEFNAQAGTQTLVSHRAGAPTAGAGAASEPVIDDDGHLVSYASTAGNLIPGQGGTPGVQNIFVWLRQTNANILASGQGGSPTVTGNADSDGPLLTRDSFPVFSSRATNLVNGIGGTSVAYLNTLVSVSLAPNTVAVGSPSGSVVGGLSVSSLLQGQFLPPVYSLPAGEASNGLFGISNAALVTAFAPTGAAGYLVRVHVNVGFGDDAVVLNVFAAIPAPGGGFVGGPDPLGAMLVSVRVGKHKTARLMVEVFDMVTGAEVEAFLSPFQSPSYRAITLTPLANGLFQLSARKGKHTVTLFLTV